MLNLKIEIMFIRIGTESDFFYSDLRLLRLQLLLFLFVFVEKLFVVYYFTHRGNCVGRNFYQIQFSILC